MELLKGVMSVWIWLEITLLCCVGALIQQVVAWFTVPFDRQRRIVGRFFRLIAVAAIKLSPMWRFKIHGPIPKVIPRKTVVISNHVSHLDSFLISHLPWEMKWLGKESLFKVPFLGWAMRTAGDIPVRRGAADSVVKAMQRCAEYLRQDMPVCIFPEGTRSTTDTMLPFKDGAFRLAIQEGAEILPLAVAGTRKALPKHSWRFNFAQAVVTVGQPIVTTGLGLDAVDDVKAQARQQIERMLSEIRPLVSPD